PIFKVISEIEFAFPYAQNVSIGITGSNGKTTTSLLTYHLLKQGGIDVGLAGNIGESYAKQLVEHPEKLFVLELSSFQLDGNIHYKPHIRSEEHTSELQSRENLVCRLL